MIGRALFFNVMWRILLLFLTGSAIIYVAFRMQGRESVFTIFVGSMLVVAQIYFLTRYLLRVNKILTSFIESVGLVNAPELHFRVRDPLFSGLESGLNQLKSELSRSRFEEQKQKSLLDIVLSSMDTGIVCVNQDRKIVFSNNAAGTIFGDLGGSHTRDLESKNSTLAEALESSRSGSPRMVDLPEYRATVRCNNFLLDDTQYSLFTIQNIQREIETQESESWQKLIRVLTHEIMNSMGPILSLSKSLKNSANQPGKVISGLSSIETAGEGLIRFIKEYRKLSNLPLPDKSRFPVAEIFEHIRSLYSEEFKRNQVQFNIQLEDEELFLTADRGQIEQILINLVKNAIESLEGKEGGIIELRAISKDGKALIEVEDNGPGIPGNIRDQVFVPFFSTKNNGTGIGLSLARQIMNHHDGSIHFLSGTGGKTIFRLIF